jgi:peroxiredoxin
MAQKDRIKAAGVDAIVCVSVNDPFVMKAYGKHLAPAEAESREIRFLADTAGELGRRLGLLFDATAALGGERWRRANLLIEEGTIKYAEVENGGSYTKTGATEFLHSALGDVEAPVTEFDPPAPAPTA